MAHKKLMDARGQLNFTDTKRPGKCTKNAFLYMLKRIHSNPLISVRDMVLLK